MLRLFNCGLLWYCTVLYFTITSDAQLCPAGAEGPFGTCLCISGFTGYDCSQRVCPSAKAWADFPSANNIAHAPFTECSNMVGLQIFGALTTITVTDHNTFLESVMTEVSRYFWGHHVTKLLSIWFIDFYRVNVIGKRVYVPADWDSQGRHAKHVSR